MLINSFIRFIDHAYLKKSVYFMQLKEMVVPVIIRKTSARDLRRTNSMEW
jgi:hypothetical protein